MKQILASIVFVGLFMPFGVPAGQAADNAERLVSILGPVGRASSEEFLKLSFDHETRDLSKTLSDDFIRIYSVPPEKIERVMKVCEEEARRILSRFEAKILETIVFDEAIRVVGVQLWRDRFTEDELAEIIGFYESAVGRKYLAESIRMFREAVQQTSKLFGKELKARLLAVADDEYPTITARIKRAAELPLGEECDQAADWLDKAFSVMANASEAATHYQQAITLCPDSSEAHLGYGVSLYYQGQYSESILELRRLLEIAPDEPRAYLIIGLCFGKMGEFGKMLEEWEVGVEHNPDHVLLRNNLAWSYATLSNPTYRNAEKALEHAECLIGLERDWMTLDTYAAALAEAGEFMKAAEAQDEAISLARAKAEQGEEEVESKIRACEGRRQLYQERKPYREE